MDVEKNEELIVLDCGKEPEEVAAEAGCCVGRPSAPSSASIDR
jgi:hypothetical protein